MIYIDGRISGNISSKDSVVIGKNGSIEGNIEANKVVINGKIVGNIDANNIEILAGAEFKGDMEVFELSCEASAKFMGHCKYREERKPERARDRTGGGCAHELQGSTGRGQERMRPSASSVGRRERGEVGRDPRYVELGETPEDRHFHRPGRWFCRRRGGTCNERRSEACDTW